MDTLARSRAVVTGMGDGRTVGGVGTSESGWTASETSGQWSRGGGTGAPKPLLLLYVLGRLQRTGTSKVSYADAEPTLTELLRNFGPPGRKTSPAYPSTICRAIGSGPCIRGLAMMSGPALPSSVAAELPASCRLGSRRRSVGTPVSSPWQRDSCSTPTSPSRCTATSAQSSGWIWKGWRCGRLASGLHPGVDGTRNFGTRSWWRTSTGAPCATTMGGSEPSGRSGCCLGAMVGVRRTRLCPHALCLCSFHHKLPARFVERAADAQKGERLDVGAEQGDDGFPVSGTQRRISTGLNRTSKRRLDGSSMRPSSGRSRRCIESRLA
jgi:hypothetical protein